MFPFLFGDQLLYSLNQQVSSGSNVVRINYVLALNETHKAKKCDIQ